MSNTVKVSGISGQTGEKEIRDFFSFCGKIQSLDVKPIEGAGGEKQQGATVTFEKESAAKTALLLDNTQLGPAQVHVEADSSAASSSASAGATTSSSSTGHDDSSELAQEDKPRSRVVAEYLAHGYTLNDQVIEKALALDKQHGISTRFQKALTDFDAKFGATEKATAVDQKLGVTQKATAGWQGLNSYFEKAIGTPTGQKLRSFYEQGQKQVIDVHNEARHLADLKSKHATTANGLPYDPTAKQTPEEAQLEKAGDGSKTKCNCQGGRDICACQPGNCSCNGCSKSEEPEKAAAAA